MSVTRKSSAASIIMYAAGGGFQGPSGGHGPARPKHCAGNKPATWLSPFSVWRCLTHLISRPFLLHPLTAWPLCRAPCNLGLAPLTGSTFPFPRHFRSGSMKIQCFTSRISDSLLATSSSSAHPSQRSPGSASGTGAGCCTCIRASMDREPSTGEVPSSRSRQQNEGSRDLGLSRRIQSQMKVATLAAGLSLGAVTPAHAESFLPLTTSLLAADASVSPILSLPEGFSIPENLSFDQLPLLISSLPALAGFENAVPALTLPALNFSLPALSLPAALGIPEILVSAGPTAVHRSSAVLSGARLSVLDGREVSAECFLPFCRLRSGLTFLCSLHSFLVCMCSSLHPPTAKWCLQSLGSLLWRSLRYRVLGHPSS